MRLTKRLPDGQAVVDCENCERHEKGCTALYCRNRLKNALAEYEDIDAAPVVRCRDCRKMKTYECPMQSCGYDDFCSYGERRERNADR